MYGRLCIAVVVLACVPLLAAPAAMAAKPASSGSSFTGLPLSLDSSTLTATSLLGVDTSQITVDSSQLMIDVKTFKARKGTIVAVATVRGKLLLRDAAGAVIGTVDVGNTSVTAVVTGLTADCNGNLSARLQFNLRSSVTVTLATTLGTLTVSVDANLTLHASISVTGATGTPRRLICDIAHNLPLTSSTVDRVVSDLNALFGSTLTGLSVTVDSSLLDALLQALSTSGIQVDASALTVDIKQFATQDGTIVATALIKGTAVLRDTSGTVIGTIDLNNATVTARISDLSANCMTGSLSATVLLGVHIGSATITLSTSIGNVSISLSGSLTLRASISLTNTTGDARTLVCDISRLLPVTDASAQQIVNDLNSLLTAV